MHLLLNGYFYASNIMADPRSATSLNLNETGV